MQLAPHSTFRPGPEASPTGGAAPTAHFRRQELPRKAGAEDEEDARQHGAVGDPRAPAAAAGRAFPGKQRFHARPEFIRDERSHGPPT
jgi:hypothetical protein